MSNNNVPVVNYDTFIRNNTMLCNFLEYDNLLSNNKLKPDDQFNHTKLKAIKTVLSNEDQALTHLLSKPQQTPTNFDTYTTEELLNYRDYLKNEYEQALPTEYNNLEDEFNKLYHLKELLMTKLIEISILNESGEDNDMDDEANLKKLETILIDKLVNRLDTHNTELITLLKNYND